MPTGWCWRRARRSRRRCPGATAGPPSMRLRTITEADLGRVLACTTDDPVGVIDPELLRRRFADGPDRPGLAVNLLGEAHEQFLDGGMSVLPAYHVFLPTGWRDQPDVVAALQWRQQAAQRAGLTRQLERLRYQWTPAAGLPAHPGRLEFRAEPDDEAFLAAFLRVAEGSLDATTTEGAAAVGAYRQARDAMRYYLSMPSPRDWWRLAYTPQGGLAGLAIPARNADGPVVAYLGVVPELRGNGYIDDLLAEVTHLLAAAGARWIQADTDLASRPMAAAFQRAGYRNFAVRMVLSASMYSA